MLANRWAIILRNVKSENEISHLWLTLYAENDYSLDLRAKLLHVSTRSLDIIGNSCINLQSTIAVTPSDTINIFM